MRSVLLWRIVVIVVVTVLLASLLMTGGYMYFSRDAYAAIKLAELSGEVQAMAQLYMEYNDAGIELASFLRILNAMMQSSDTTGIIVDAGGQEVYHTISVKEFKDEAYAALMREQIQAALEGSTTQTPAVPMSSGYDALSVCMPIQDAKGNIVGAAYILKSPVEIMRTTSRLNNTLVMAMAVVLPFMLLFSTLSARRVTEPLHAMGEVAIKMSQGDFQVRANEDEIGEVGLLARALNNLCDTLSQIIYQLRAEKSQLRAILASLSEGVAATDSVGCLTLYNPSLIKMVGAVRVGTRYELIPDEWIWDAFDEVYATGKEKTLRHPMQNERILWITIAPVIADDGARTGVVGLFKDMTEVENMEASRTDFIQNISHELRAPLTAMRGLLEPLADGMVKEEADRDRYYKIMLREVLRLSRLITDMKQLASIQTGTEYVEFSEVDINELLEDIQVNYAKEAAQRGITLAVDAPKMPRVITDPDRIEQIIVILLSNAMRYTPEGGSIVLRAQNCARVNISIIDTGTGIPEKDLPHVFERFYTVDKSRKEGNTGLGLSIAQQLIEKLGERIIVQSEEGKGACFTFTLKKHVSNAIALGPAPDDWTEQTLDPLPLQDWQAAQETPATRDAVFEVLQEKRKPPEKKRGK